MSEKEQVDIMINQDILGDVVLLIIKTILEGDGSHSVVVPVGQVAGVALEIGGYHVDLMESEDQLELEIDNPGVYEQLSFKFLH